VSGVGFMGNQNPINPGKQNPIFFMLILYKAYPLSVLILITSLAATNASVTLKTTCVRVIQ
jgi:hypothetical protein